MKKIEKTEETEIETAENKNKNEQLQQKQPQSKISESISENNSKIYTINNSSKSSTSKIDFVETIIKGNRRDSFENLLKEEAERIDKINLKKDNLKNINLKESVTDNLYEWNTLFNNSKPIYYYTKGKNIINKKKIEENKLESLKAPVVLVDLPDDKMKIFFGKNSLGSNLNISSSNRTNKNTINNENTISKSEKKTRPKSANPHKKFASLNNFNKNKKNKTKTPRKSDATMTKSKLNTESYLNNTNNNFNNSNANYNHIRPMSVYSNHSIKDTFYFSNAFSDYYKEDLKSFTEKMPILKAKIVTKKEKLQKEMKKQNIKSTKKEQKLYDMLLEDNLLLKKEDLIIAADRKNPTPLLKSIYKQENPESIEIKEHVKLYFNTMKPYGNDDGHVDYTQNDRWRLSKEIPKLRRKFNQYKYGKSKKNKVFSAKNKKLVLNYYDENDPDIRIFKNLKEDPKKLINTYNYIISKTEKQIEITKNEKENQNSKTEKQIEILKNEKETQNLKNEKENQNSVKSENNSEKNITIIKPKQKKRPLTGIRKNSENKNFKITENKKKLIRPKSSKISRPHHDINSSNFIHNNNNSSITFSELFKDYMPSNRFPLKTNSNVANVSYGKINQMIHERKLVNRSSQDYFMTQTGYTFYNLNSLGGNENKKNKKNLFKQRPKTADILGRSKKNVKKKWDKNGQIKREKNVNYFYFNHYIDTEFPENIFFNKDEKIHHGPMNCFNKLAGKYYSSSNNVNITNKRNKRKEMFENFKGNKIGGYYLNMS